MEATMVSLIITFFISFILYLTIEQPFAKILRSFFAILSQSKPSSHGDSPKSTGISLQHHETCLKA
jgi:peptidoglycan/LPS O-acetylase OafA/YrhL